MQETNETIKIQYLYHSGFLAETPEVYYLFDYYKGTLPKLDKTKPVFVFVSHSHADHYNPEIFSLLTSLEMESITAVLANDISQKRYPDCLTPASPENLNDTLSRQAASTPPNTPMQHPAGSPASLHTRIIPALRVYHSQEYELPCRTHLQTLLSTDKGVAFLLTCPWGSIYHAGDLNDWITEETPEKERRQMTGQYLASIGKLKGKSLDVAFLPLDPRLGKYYANGILAFLKTIEVKRAYPMHYWEQPEIITQFLREHPEYTEVMVNPVSPP